MISKNEPAFGAVGQTGYEAFNHTCTFRPTVYVVANEDENASIRILTAGIGVHPVQQAVEQIELPVYVADGVQHNTIGYPVA